tara:strand:+ start:383 stop:607 length:225 start_codon:yes stop_codon:yes gene_type:complete
MVHPLAQLNHLTDTELQEKLDDLNKKYWMASNPDVRNQIVLMLDSLKLEQENRQIKQKKEENQDNNLDNLINIS